MKLRMTPDQVFEQAVKGGRLGAPVYDNIEFSPRTQVARIPISSVDCSKR